MGGTNMNTRTIFISAAAVLAVSCAKEVLPEKNGPVSEPVLVPMEFVASPETKAYISEGTDGIVLWNDDENICIFDDLGGDQKFAAATGGATACFSGNVTAGASEFYALYPYREGAGFDVETKKIASTLYPDQIAVRGSYAKGDGGAVMVAKADADKVLSFRNVTSHIRFTLAEDMTDVKSITLIGNRSEALCGTYSVDWNGGEPLVTITGKETYVTLKNEDGSALVPGDYFFTVLPVEFTEGFTVILSKMETGEQVAKKTLNPITGLNRRNQILPMAALAKEDYSEHMNYFVRYNDDFDITIGGYTFNKTDRPGGVLVNDTKGNGSLNKDGLYFVDHTATTAKISSNFAPSSYIVIGTEDGTRSKLSFTKQLRPADKGVVFMMANLDVSMGMDGHSFAHHSTSTFADFGAFVFSDCHFRAVPRTFMSFTSAAVNVDSIVITDCDYCATPKNVNDNGVAYLLGLADKASSIKNLTMTNNVLYFVKENVDVTDFKVINAKAATVNNITFSNNTLVGMMTKQSGGFMYIGTLDGTCNMTGNLFVNSHPVDAWVPMISPSVATSETSGAINKCFYYVEGGNRAVSVPDVIKGKDGVAVTKVVVSSPKALSASPLNTDWNPSEGKFGPYVGVDAGVGAQRSDMTLTQTDSPSLDYGSSDLGTI